MTVTALTQIASHANPKKIYAEKGERFTAEFYGLNHISEKLFLCENKGVKFITNEDKLIIPEK